jgi:AI-2 transport protein TqsA
VAAAPLQQPPTGRTSQRLLNLASVVVIVAGLKLGAPVLVPFMVAVFLAMLTLPVLSWLEHHRVPRSLAVTLAVFANLGLLAAVGWLVSIAMAGLLGALPGYREEVGVALGRWVRWLEAHGLPAAQWLEEGLFDASSMFDLLTSTLRGVAAIATELLLVITLMVFLLLEVAGLAEKLQTAFGQGRAALLWRYARIRLEVQRYLVIKTLVSVATGVLIGLLVAWIGLDLPLLWGVLAFFFNYIPNIGSIVAAIPAVGLALIQMGLGGGVLVGLAYLAVNLLIGNILEPQLMGRRMGLSPLVVFASLIFWGWVWGPVGMFLSLPLTVIARIVFENSRELRWIAVLLASDPPATGDEELELDAGL